MMQAILRAAFWLTGSCCIVVLHICGVCLSSLACTLAPPAGFAFCHASVRSGAVGSKR